MKRTRRAVLAAAVSGAAATAGCAGLPVGGGSGGSDGTGESPLRQWVPTRETDGPRRAWYRDIERFRGLGLAPRAVGTDETAVLEGLGVDVAPVTESVAVDDPDGPSAFVFLGSFDPEPVRSTVDGESVGDHRGRSLFRVPSPGPRLNTGSVVAAVDDSTLVVGGFGEADPVTALVRRVLDAEAGAVGRAAGGSDFDAVLSRTEDGAYHTVTAPVGRSPIDSEDLVALGTGAGLGGDLVDVTLVFLFTDADAADADLVRDGLDLGARYGSLSYERDGRAVVVTGGFDPAGSN